jgi:predicted nucleotidyltransferase
MVQVPNHIVAIVKRYIAAIEAHGIHLQQAILFGSYTNGRYTEWSDIDVALVSDDFQGIRFYDREKLSQPTLQIDARIDPLPYQTKDFTEENFFVQEILKSGVKIA